MKKFTFKEIFVSFEVMRTYAILAMKFLFTTGKDKIQTALFTVFGTAGTYKKDKL